MIGPGLRPASYSFRILTAERTIVAHVNPTSTGIGLPLGQDRHGRVVAVQPLSGEDMRLKPPEKRGQHRATGADLVGQGRQPERHALVAFGLANQPRGDPAVMLTPRSPAQLVRTDIISDCQSRDCAHPLPQPQNLPFFESYNAAAHRNPITSQPQLSSV
jgi:hypothetical protein